MKPDKKDTTIQDQNLKVFKQNAKILNKLSNSKMKRHVKEQNEPVFEGILEDFRKDYGLAVVSESCREIFKESKDE